MKLYAFELGRKKELCFAELISVLKQKNLVERNLDTAIFRMENLVLTELQDRLGGTIKIIELSGETTKSNLKSDIQKLLEKTLKNRAGKIPFSMSALSFKNPQEINIKELLNFSKKFLKSLGIKNRFVNKDFKNTKPSTIYKAKVIKKGIDICIIKGKNSLLLGHSITIQNIDAYSLRDYDKPRRDARAGMLPPKLAQIMINLAGNPGIIYDPFCGTGTVLTESMLMEKTAIGSDIEPRMVKFSKENCEWLAQEFNTSAIHRIFQKDAQNLTKEDLPEEIDAIVTEGYLGKALSTQPSETERQKIFQELSSLHLNWLKAVHKFIPKHCKIVMCVAAFMNKNTLEHLPDFVDLAEKAGYRVLQTFTYDRPDQIVVRDIKILEKV